MTYIVPLETPEFCNKCPFGMCNYSKPLWGRPHISKIDGKENIAGTHGYICNIEYKDHNKYTKVMRATIDEDIKKPDWCKLKRV